MTRRASHARWSSRFARILGHTLGEPRDSARALASLLFAGSSGRSFDDLLQDLGTRAAGVSTTTQRLIGRGAAEQAVELPAMVGATRPRLRGWLADLRRAYVEGGLRALETAHFRNCSMSRAYRTAFSGLAMVCPLTELLALGGVLDEQLDFLSLPDAATHALSHLPERWEIRYPQIRRQDLEDAPLIIYGNHPSMLTPFLVAAAVERTDVRIVAHAYVARLVPGLSQWVLPVERSAESTVRSGLMTGLSHQVSLGLLRRLDGLCDPSVAKEINRRSIREGADTVASGGAVLIFPGGGHVRGPWYPGLGRLVLSALASPHAKNIRLVPVHVENNSNSRVYRLISKHRTAEWLRKRLHRVPIRLTIGDPIPLDRLHLRPGASPQEVSSLLRAHYDRLSWGSGEAPRSRL